MTGSVNGWDETGSKSGSRYFTAWCDNCGRYLNRGTIKSAFYQTKGPAENALIIHMAREHEELWVP